MFSKRILHESDNLCEIRMMFGDTILEPAGLSCTQIYKQNVELHFLRFERKSNQNKQHGDKGW